MAAGEAAILPIRTFCAKAESLTWPLKILKDLVPTDRYVEELIRLLERSTPNTPATSIPSSSSSPSSSTTEAPAIRLAVERFLEDASEAIRFAAVATVLAQEDAACSRSARKVSRSRGVGSREEPDRRGLVARGWALPEEIRDDAKKALPPGFGVDAQGKVKRR